MKPMAMNKAMYMFHEGIPLQDNKIQWQFGQNTSL